MSQHQLVLENLARRQSVIRVCKEVVIEIIFANSAQGKGRIELSLDTFLDRLIPEESKRPNSSKCPWYSADLVAQEPVDYCPEIEKKSRTAGGDTMLIMENNRSNWQSRDRKIKLQAVIVITQRTRMKLIYQS